ncbi:MAG: hypothetical protein JRJ03_17735 [Deltaproteobacteria bacterium]|nr:hypothetical protein [Deltaproteobacteria bacterium]
MTQTPRDGIVDMIGKENFQWLSQKFDKGTRLKDVPETILERVGSVDITIRDYGRDRAAVTTIAMITFAYRMAGKVQDPKYGSNDIALLKVLAKREILRRRGEVVLENRMWDAPLCQIITGEVGERIRAAKLMTNPM